MTHKAIFLVGGPGSGKDYLVNHIFPKFNLSEVQVEHILTGKADPLVDAGENLVINGITSEEQIRLAKQLMEGYDFDTIYVSVSNKVSRIRNSERKSPLHESIRIKKLISSEKIVKSLGEHFVFDNSIDYKNCSEMEEVILAGRIEKLLERIVGFGVGLVDSNKVAKSIDEAFAEAFEFGTDAYFKHTTDMTPGQSQEIEDATAGYDLFSEFPDQNQESGCGCGCGGKTAECQTKTGRTIPESNGNDRRNSGKPLGSFKRKIREEIRDTIETEPTIQTKEDGVEEDEDQNTETKRRRLRNAIQSNIPSEYLDGASSGLSITSSATSLF